MSWTYFADRDLGRRFPETLAAAGIDVRRHDLLFPQDLRDEAWLEYCGTHGLVAITHNERIRYTPNELAAVVRHRVALLVVVGKTPLPVLANNFVATRTRTEAFLASHRAPFIAKIYRPDAAVLARDPSAPGDIRLWYPR